jgi:hypothetical protein
MIYDNQQPTANRAQRGAAAGRRAQAQGATSNKQQGGRRQRRSAECGVRAERGGGGGGAQRRGFWLLVLMMPRLLMPMSNYGAWCLCGIDVLHLGVLPVPWCIGACTGRGWSDLLPRWRSRPSPHPPPPAPLFRGCLGTSLHPQPTALSSLHPTSSCSLSNPSNLLSAPPLSMRLLSDLRGCLAQCPKSSRPCSSCSCGPAASCSKPKFRCSVAEQGHPMPRRCQD